MLNIKGSPRSIDDALTMKIVVSIYLPIQHDDDAVAVGATVADYVLLPCS